MLRIFSATGIAAVLVAFDVDMTTRVSKALGGEGGVKAGVREESTRDDDKM